MTTRRETELVALRRLADELAGRRTARGITLTTGHLLAAIASHSCPAADLLLERRLGPEVLLSAARVTTDDAKDAVDRAIQRAREIAGRTGAREPDALHLLLALCHDRGAGSHRALEQCGVDVGKLRAAAMQIAQGITPPRRRPVGAPQAVSASSDRPSMPPRPVSKPSAPPPSARVPILPAKVPARLAAPARPAPPPTAKATPAIPTPSPIPPKPRSAPRHAERAAPSSRFVLDPKRYPLLAQLTVNLTAQAARGELDPVVGRDAEIERTLDVLAKRNANNPCLVGIGGVGKTSVARGLAQLIASTTRVSEITGRTPAQLDDRIVLAVETARLLSGGRERLAQLKQELARATQEGHRIVLFFDEVHALFAESTGDEALGELKIGLARGELSILGATTVQDYRRTIDADPALARHFTPIEIEEMDEAEAVQAITVLGPALAQHHRAMMEPEAIVAAVRWSVRYLPGRALPDKAINVLDLAGARARRRGEATIDRRGVAEVVSELADVPLERLLETDGERLLRLQELLAARVVGHGEALSRIATVLRRNAAGLPARRPIGSFLLLGPTGVGKTETAKAIAECLFGSDTAMTRLDLSEYAEPHSIARLVGAPPGYVGHESGGQLTEAVKRRPYQVLLLDEIEKAHRDVLEAFLQVFDEGRMTDGRGRTVDFTSVVIVLTSNLGADVSMPTARRGKIGFGDQAASAAGADARRYEEAIIQRARGELPPELYNRLDEVLAFAPLSRADVAEVARRMLIDLGQQLEVARGVKLDTSEAAIGALLEGGGFDPELGARPMRRAIARLVEAPIADLFLKGQLAPGSVVTVDVEDGALVIDAVCPNAA
jgi:ATP-dependent Clp protease ATP-binding subunit ClpC